MPPVDHRESYRIVYPERARPAFHWLVGRGVHVAPVLDCSERGLRVRRPSALVELRSGDAVTGRVRWHDGEEQMLEGTIVRVTDEQVAVQLHHPGIPLRVLYAEQRYLRARYLDWHPHVSSRPAPNDQPPNTRAAD
jgi:hypothetical protein